MAELIFGEINKYNPDLPRITAITRIENEAVQ